MELTEQKLTKKKLNTIAFLFSILGGSGCILIIERLSNYALNNGSIILLHICFAIFLYQKLDKEGIGTVSNTDDFGGPIMDSIIEVEM